MELAEIYKLIDNSGISVGEVKLDNRVAFCTCTKEGYEGIGIDYSKIETTADEKFVALEEYYHLYYGLTYKLDDTRNPLRRQNIERAERRAERHAASKLVTLKMLTSAFAAGLRNLWELAEEFNVPEHAITTAIEHYKCRGLL